MSELTPPHADVIRIRATTVKVVAGGTLVHIVAQTLRTYRIVISGGLLTLLVSPIDWHRCRTNCGHRAALIGNIICTSVATPGIC